MMIQTHTLQSQVIQVTASMMIQTHTLMSPVIQVSSEQFDSTQQSDCTGTPWQPCGRERGGGEITDNLASSEWDERNEEYLLFGV